MLPNPRKFMMLLACQALLTGCAKTDSPVQIATDKLCESWRHQTIRKADRLTEPTAAQIEGNNKSRPEWGCQYGADTAKAKG